MFLPESLNLQESVFILLRDLIHEQVGLYYDQGKREMIAEKLTPLVLERGFTSFLDYYYLLKYDREASGEWPRLVDALTVKETYFWREVDSINALVDVLLPQLVSDQPGRTVRIWSAACASGEEPLTLAMALNESGWFDRARIQILASDASPSAIDRAKRGVYGKRAFRSLPPAMKEKYFTGKDGAWQVVPEIHSRVAYATANLMHTLDVDHLASSSVIFCRNVFIYFSESAIRKAVGLFYDRMPTPAYLFIGVSESLFRITSRFELREIGSAFVYCKR